jgi:thioredoxin-like negative regulator of GroEL
VISFLLQQLDPTATNQNEANEWFYSLWIWLAILLPTTLAIVLAAAKRTHKAELPHVTDMTWTLDVLEAELPVLIHAYHRWSIGDRVIEAQVEKLAAEQKDRLDAFWLDIESNPDTVGNYPTLEEKCVALFIKDRLVWQAQGVHDADTILREIEPFLQEPGGVATDEGADKIE